MLTKQQTTTLTEIIDIGVGRAGRILGELVGSPVKLHIPSVGLCPLKELESCLSLAGMTDLASVGQHFSGSLQGQAMLVFPCESGNDLARKLIGDDSSITSIDAEREETLTELGNVLLNSVIGSLSNLLGHRLDFEIPIYAEGSLGDMLPNGTGASEDAEGSQVVYANALFDIEAFRVTGNVLIIFGADSFNQLLSRIDQLASEGIPA